MCGIWRPETHGFASRDGDFHEFFQHAVETHLRRVRNVAEKSVFEIVVHRFQQLGHQQFPQQFPFPVDIRVVRTGKIDPLENTTAAFRRLQTILDLQLAAGRYHQRLAGRDLHDFRRGTVEGRLDRRPFAGRDKHFIVKIKISRPDRVRIADHERLPFSVHAAERKSAVQLAQRLVQDLLPRRRSRMQIRILFQIMGDHLRDQIPVRPARRMMPGLTEPLEEFTGIGQIEIAGQQQGPPQTAGFVHERMAGGNRMAAVGGIAQMPQQDLAVEFAAARAPSRRFLDMLRRQTRFRIQSQGSDPRSILPPVVLFFQQQGHFPEAVIGIAVFPDIIFGFLPQTQQRHRTLMFDWIRHLVPFLPYLPRLYNSIIHANYLPYVYPSFSLQFL